MNFPIVDIAIIDDEYDAIKLLMAYLENVDYVNVVGCATSFEEGVDLIQDKKPQVVLLDVQMPGKDGIELAKKIELDFDISFIFVSGELKRVIEALNLQPFDYIAKPVKKKDLIQVVNKFIEQKIVSKNNEHELETIIHLHDEKTSKFIKTSDLVFIQTDDKFPVFYDLINGKQSHRKTMFEVEKILPCRCFYRIHEDYIVNLRFVQRLDLIKRKVVLNINGKFEEFPLSLNYAKGLEKHLQICKYL